MEVSAVKVGARIAYKGDMANASGVGAVVAVYNGGKFYRISGALEESSDVMLDVVLEDGRKMSGVSMLNVGGEFANKSRRFMFVDGPLVDAAGLAMLEAGAVLRAANLKAKAELVAAEFKRAMEAAKVAGLAIGLVPASEFKGRGKPAAYNLRRELKAAGFKVISLRCSDYGMSAEVSGGDVGIAKKIAAKYKAGRFDAMSDCYDYDPSAWGSVFGDIDYVDVRGA